ncbi:MAG: cysteine--tRNA ligase [Spirochaetales bacterium]|nr:cysteine--tRNA ligase [Spirochaetales bacterium]
MRAPRRLAAAGNHTGGGISLSTSVVGASGSLPALRLYNTLGRELQAFVPLDTPRVGIYTCGPTVYNYAHIGNLRTYLFEDLLVRTLRYFGYEVRQVMNVTDVGHLTDDADEGEDKMVKSAREQGRTVWEIAEHYTRAFFADLEALDIEMPSVVCRATEHIDTMIDLIRRIEAAGYTYTADGNLYFDISKVPDYGKLAGQNLEDLKAGARIEVDPHKRNPHDFVLWFTRSKFAHQAMLWDSPWGRGYPGWHIECSAMAMKYLGEQIDIHCGGIDHIPVHHTNEIAQSEAATGKPWVRYWLHGEFLVMDKGKMAKSAGTFLTLAALRERGFAPLDYRYFCLGAHYRSPLQFSWEALEGARSARKNLEERIERLLEEAGPEAAESSTREAAADPSAAAALQAFREDVAADLNVPKALSELWGLIKSQAAPAAKLAGALEMDRVLGLGLERIRPGQAAPLEPELEALIAERTEARQRRDFARADAIRDELARRGIALEDTPEGVRWRREKE